MTPLKWLASFLALALLVFFLSRPSELTPEATPQKLSEPVANPVPSATFSAALPMKRVMDLYEAESKRVGKIDPDPKLTEKRLSAAALDLSAEEISWLGSQSLDATLDMDARFFATYLVGLSPSEASLATLKKIATSAVPQLKNERRMQEERVLRMQAVEGISHKCPLPSAKDELLEIVSVQDPGVRDRAHRALYACHTGKKIEDGDTEALQKLQKDETR